MWKSRARVQNADDHKIRHVLPDSFVWLAAAEVRCVIDAAAALVTRSLRIRTQRACSHDLAFYDPARFDACGRRVFLCPLDQRSRHVERTCSHTSAAVKHSG